MDRVAVGLPWVVLWVMVPFGEGDVNPGSTVLMSVPVLVTAADEVLQPVQLGSGKKIELVTVVVALTVVEVPATRVSLLGGKTPVGTGLPHASVVVPFTSQPVGTVVPVGRPLPEHR